MRVTNVLRGIRGVFPIIKQHAPACITTLPSFAALPRSTRLAIDATLLVQRLHFADDTHPQRHALGFYRLVNQLRDHGLVPIMVFDNVGQGARLPAKMREHERRRRTRSMLALRARVETVRAARLEALQSVLKKWIAVEDERRREVASLLTDWQRRIDELQEGPQQDEHLATEDLDRVFASIEDTVGKEAQMNPDRKSQEDALVEEDNDGLFTTTIDGAMDEHNFWHEIETAQEAMSLPVHESHPVLPDMWSEISDAETSGTIRLATEISDLMRQFKAYQQSSMVSGVGSNEAGDISWPTETPAQSRLSDAERSVYAKLTAGEADAALEDNLVKDTEAAKEDAHGAMKATIDASAAVQESGPDSRIDPAAPAPTEDLAALSAQSAAIQRSYVKSGTPLSSSIFRTCADICELLKIPVLWTGDGSRELGRPHEGEAMAAMLVRQGYADIVVSEDSDVLLYDVPLLRGVMGHKKLELIDSVAVRRTFFPPLATPGEAEAAAEAVGQEVQPDDLCAETHAENQSRRQMLEFALLCGTDFNRTLPGIAGRRALTLIRDFKTIEAVHAEAVRRHEAKLIAEKNAKKTGHGVKSVAALAAERANEEGSTSSSLSTRSLVGDAALRMPDDLTWREYSKELTRARHVFTHPPSLYWQQRKIRALKRPLPSQAQERVQVASPEEEEMATTTNPLPPLTRDDQAAAQAYLARLLNGSSAGQMSHDVPFTSRNVDDAHMLLASQRRLPSDSHHVKGSLSGEIPVSKQQPGFGNTPYGDGGPVASWSW